MISEKSRFEIRRRFIKELGVLDVSIREIN